MLVKTNVSYVELPKECYYRSFRCPSKWLLWEKVDFVTESIYSTPRRDSPEEFPCGSYDVTMHSNVVPGSIYIILLRVSRTFFICFSEIRLIKSGKFDSFHHLMLLTSVHFRKDDSKTSRNIYSYPNIALNWCKSTRDVGFWEQRKKQKDGGRPHMCVLSVI